MAKKFFSYYSFIPPSSPRLRRASISRASFTLIELLVVIAILSILSITVILTLNPAELLKQGRDSTRLSDLALINKALNVYQVDSPSGSFGNSSTTYISIPDPTATSTTQGNACTSLGLPSLPSGYAYHCPASSTYRNTDGTGWIPVNFASISYGSPMGSLPVDPLNNASTSYYTYTPGGSWMLTAMPESNKVRTTQANQITGAITAGNNLSLSPLFNPNGLVGYWKFDEGSGSTAQDSSGNGNGGTLQSSPSYTAGEISTALHLNGSGQYVNVPYAAVLAPSNAITVSVWVRTSNWNPGSQWSGIAIAVGNNGLHVKPTSPVVRFQLSINGTNETADSGNLSTGQWYHLAGTYDKDGGSNNFKLWVNAVIAQQRTATGTISIAQGWWFGNYSSGTYFLGDIDDIRIYSRALSAAEIMALYNATR